MSEMSTKYEVAQSTRIDVKHEVAQRLIEAMEQGNTPWQKPWGATAMRPTNPTTNNVYKGINRILLSMSGYSSNLFLTYQQAAEKGWQVKKGEKGTMIVKVVEWSRDGSGKGGSGQDTGSASPGGDAGAGQRSADRDQNKSFALKRYFVFNAEQIEGFPMPESQPDKAFETVEKAEGVVEALKEKTGLMVIHGGDKAVYVPSLHEIRLPPRKSFLTEYDYFSTNLHECCHATLHEKCLNRSDAIGKRWGDAAYALEELRAEIGSAILCAETGVSARVSPEHVARHTEHHAAYLRSWIKAIQNDPMAIFSAAKDADRIAEYLLGLERERSAMAPHREWVEDYQRGDTVQGKESLR